MATYVQLVGTCDMLARCMDRTKELKHTFAHIDDGVTRDEFAKSTTDSPNKVSITCAFSTSTSDVLSPHTLASFGSLRQSRRDSTDQDTHFT